MEFYFGDRVYLRYHFLAVCEKYRYNVLRVIGVGEQLQIEQEEQKHLAEVERQTGMLRLADRFEASIKGIVETVASAATEMQGTASVMTHTADTASQQATVVAAASEEASANVQTVAAATEELSSSIAEIGRQITARAKSPTRR